MLYLLRVALISQEFLLIAVMIAIDYYFSSPILSLSKNISVNDELLKWAILLPTAVFVWSAKEARDLLGTDKDTLTLIVNWPWYKKLKTHVHVAVAYAFLFALLACIPWLTKDGISEARGVILFIGGTLGNLLVAESIYSAHINMKEAIHRS